MDEVATIHQSDLDLLQVLTQTDLHQHDRALLTGPLVFFDLGRPHPSLLEANTSSSLVLLDEELHPSLPILASESPNLGGVE